MLTPGKNNIEPENGPLEDYFPLQTCGFSGSNVNLPECTLFQKTHPFRYPVDFFMLNSFGLLVCYNISYSRTTQICTM